MSRYTLQSIRDQRKVITTKLFGKRTESGIQPVSSERASGTETTKLVHIVEMKEGETTARHDVYLTPGPSSKVSKIKKDLGYGPKDGLVRAKNRQILSDEVSLFDIAESGGEKYILIPDTEVGA